MSAPTKPAVYWKPAPFAIYAPDRRRIWLEHALALCCLLVFAAALMPRPAGHDAQLLVPVAYHRLLLDERAPAVIELNLPDADYNVEPQSLGYFTPSGEFVYTAAVARGLIYGRCGGKAYILELAAPEDSRAFLEFHLDQIREGVLEQNRLANLLAQARSAAEDPADDLERAVINAYKKLGAAALLAEAAEARALASQAGVQPLQAQDALKHYSRGQSALKQRYYACQRARLDVLGQKAALQLALAHLPDPPSSELLSLGDRELVAETLEHALAQLENTWRTRLRGLQEELAGAPVEPPQTLPFDGPAGVLPPPPQAHESAPGPEELARTMRSARREVLQAEAIEIRRSLEKLALVRSQALTGRPPGWTDLPHLAFAPRELAQPSLAALPGYGALLGLEGEPEPTLGLLRQLARRFEGRLPATGEPAPILAQQGFPFELPYGLLAVDLAQRREVMAGAGEPPVNQAPAPALAEDGGKTPRMEPRLETARHTPAQENTELAPAPEGNAETEVLPAVPAHITEGIEVMLDYPDVYGLASLDMAYLRCLSWYAGLSRGQVYTLAQD